ncbi:MAG: PD-(D/E)XK nuclease family protein [Clostridia bacterium]|nr:PD-(D/E)XK nuclease family protein [Clostridia bacterium]
MLTLIESGFGFAGSEKMLSLIKEAAKKHTPSLLIVPEHRTVSFEAKMCRILPADAPLYFEVTNFTRLANSTFRALGGISGEYCDKTRRSLIMWRALTELAPLLKQTRGRGEIPAGTVERALSGIGELSRFGIQPQELAEASRAEGMDRRLREKLSDLSLIYSTYKGLLSEKYKDTEDDIAEVIKRLALSPDFLFGTEIFVLDFTSFTEGQYRLLTALAERTSVTVHLPLPRSAPDAFEFTEIKSARDKLLRLAERAGVERKILRVGERDAASNERLVEIASYLWHTEGKIDNNCLQGDELRIFEADTPFEECSFVAADIARRVRLGASYSDFAIIAGSAESYHGIIDTALADAAIPHFVSRVRDLCTFEAIKLIFSAYKIISRGFCAEDVLSYAKLGLADVSAEEADEIELYVEKWGIGGKRFTDGEDWCMSPRGYVPLSEDDVRKLARLNEIKERLIAPLVDFRDTVPAIGTVREHAEALVGFLGAIRLEERLAKRSERLLALGEVGAAEENSNLWGVICSSLDTLVEVLGDIPASPDSFINQLSVVFRGVTVGKIPTHVDEVVIGSADMLRVGGKRYVYLIGVNYGVFPGVPKDGAYFTERECVQLAALGLAIEPELDKRGARELFSFSRAFTSARDGVTLTYTRHTSAYGEAHPAEVIKRIEEITEGAAVPRKISELPIYERTESAAAALNALPSLGERAAEALRLALTEAGFGEELTLSEAKIVNDTLSLSEVGTGLIYRGDIYLSQTRIDTFLRCPMSYFLKYNLKLEGAERAELGANVIGSFIHSILENFFAEVKERGGDASTLGADERRELTARAAKHYVREAFGDGYGSARTEVAISRLMRAAEPVVEGLCDEFANCRFTPVFFELKTSSSSNELPDPVVFTTRDGTKAIINGTVDRVDAFTDGNKTYVRVVDYKTGSKEFSPSDIAEGRNLQMFLYLKAITETEKPAFREALGAAPGGELVPAGVIYVKASVGDVTVDTPSDEAATEAVKAAQGRSGMLLDDESSIAAMNPAYLPIKSYGERMNDTDRRRLYTEEGWQKIGETIGEVISDVCADMKGGCIEARNTDGHGNSTCTFCSYRSVCRNYLAPSKR